jgi:predicted permease
VERYLSDVRTSLRIFRRSPGLALSAVLALAMGIGFVTTMFGIVRGGTRGLPFPDPEELVVLTRTVPHLGHDLEPSLFDFLAWSRRQQSFAGLAAFEEQSRNLSGDRQRPERRSGARVTPNTFDLLQVRPARGRPLLDSDASPGAPAVALLGHELWQARFDGDPGILGRVIRLDGVPHTVVGVMPPGFGFPVRSSLWIPLVIDGEPLPTAQGTGLRVFGRLREDVSLGQARAELATLAAAIGRDHSATHGNLSARLMPFVEVEMAPNTAAILYLMLGIVSFVLLIACANVANLLLARAAMRSRETALRTALGAGRTRILLLQVYESLGLAAVGGGLGLAVAWVAVRFFGSTTAGIIDAFWIDFRVDWAVALFATGLVGLAGVAAGLIPGLRASGGDVAEVLKDASGSATGLRIGRLARGLVVVEVMLATGFLIMTMTFTRTAIALRAINLPFPAREIFTGQLGLTQETLGAAGARVQLVRDLTARLDALPGVGATALVSVLPGRGAGNWTFTLDAPARPGGGLPNTTGLALVTPGFFDLVGARMLRGRALEWRDGPDAPGVAVVNQSWVRLHSPDRDPLGRQIWFGDRRLEVVGVVPDLQMQDPEDQRGDGVYASLLQVRPYVIRVMARAGSDPLALTPVIRDAVEGFDPDVPLFEVASLYQAIYSDKKVLDAFGTLFFAFGLGALFLTMVGVYGVVSFAVTRRVREIGVRVALGARPRDIARLVLGEGAVLIGAGTLAGLVIAFGLSHALAAVTEFVRPAGIMTYLAIAAALTVTAAAGLLRPVRRSLALEPMEALRRD